MADHPWIFRAYSGHSTPEASNELYRTNLAKVQTGLSIAFDLPTQTGYDADHPLAAGEVGKVGVPIASIEDMDRLLEAIPLDRMNTSMTINATAVWLLALYIAVAERRGVDRRVLQGNTQNDIIKEYLSRGTYIFPPSASMQLTTDMIEVRCSRCDQHGLIEFRRGMRSRSVTAFDSPVTAHLSTPLLRSGRRGDRVAGRQRAGTYAPSRPGTSCRG